jgi:hypothetical protein
MIVLKAPLEQVLDALQVVAGNCGRRHQLPVLAEVMISRRGSGATYFDYMRRVFQQTPAQTVVVHPCGEPARPVIKLKRAHAQALSRGFFGATKVNARNAP